MREGRDGLHAPGAAFVEHDDRQRGAMLDREIGPYRPQQMLGPDQEGLAVEASAVAHDEVELVFLEQGGKPSVRLDDDVDVDPRVLVPEGAQDVDEPRRGEVLHDAEADPARHHLAVEAPPDLVVERDDLARIRHQHLAFRGQVQPLRRALEQRDADQPLELADLHADGGLRPVQRSRGSVDGADLGDGEEGAQQVGIQIGHGGCASSAERDRSRVTARAPLRAASRRWSAGSRWRSR